MEIEYGYLFLYVLAAILLLLIVRILLKPIQFFLKILYKLLLGGSILFLINYIGGFLNFSIPINIFSASILGFLGIPGFGLLMLIKFDLF